MAAALPAQMSRCRPATQLRARPRAAPSALPQAPAWQHSAQPSQAAQGETCPSRPEPRAAQAPEATPGDRLPFAAALLWAGPVAEACSWSLEPWPAAGRTVGLRLPGLLAPATQCFARDRRPTKVDPASGTARLARCRLVRGQHAAWVRRPEPCRFKAGGALQVRCPATWSSPPARPLPAWTKPGCLEARYSWRLARRWAMRRWGAP